MDFPRLVYRSASVHILAKTKEEHDDLLAKGWHASVPEAMGAAGAGEVKVKVPVKGKTPAKGKV